MFNPSPRGSRRAGSREAELERPGRSLDARASGLDARSAVLSGARTRAVAPDPAAVQLHDPIRKRLELLAQMRRDQDQVSSIPVASNPIQHLSADGGVHAIQRL